MEVVSFLKTTPFWRFHSGGPKILRVGIQNAKVCNFFFDYESLIFGMYSTA
jgi:hypothetical protein